MFLLPFFSFSLSERDAASDVDSEEERDIMREIKNEITQQVRGEMKAELDTMKRKIEKDSGVDEWVYPSDKYTYHFLIMGF